MSRPDFLKGEAATKWDQVAAHLGDVDPRDEGMLVSLCLAWRDMIEADTQLHRAGETLTVTGAQGNTVANPLIGIRDRSMAKYIAISIQFGLSPRARGGGSKKKSASAAIAERLGK